MNNNKKIMEVELRALVSDLQLLKSKLKEAGAKYVSESTLHDIYFCDKSVNTLEEVEMHDIGSYSLRLRRYENNKKVTNSLNTKTITKTDDHHAWEEHETEVENFTETAKILAVTEFKPYFDLEKIRIEYSLGELGIFIDDIKDFGPCIEVEILTEPGNEEEAKETILKFLETVGVEKDDVVPKSVTNIVMKKRAFNTKISV